MIPILAFAAAISAALNLEVGITLILISGPQVLDGTERLHGVLTAAVANLSTLAFWPEVDRSWVIHDLKVGSLDSQSSIKSV